VNDNDNTLRTKRTAVHKLLQKSNSKTENRKMSIIQSSYICIILLCLMLMSGVTDSKCTCCQKLNDHCCKTLNKKDACCAVDGSIDDKEKHDWSNENAKQCKGKTITVNFTLGEGKICKTDEVCRELHPDMDCVRRYGSVLSKVVNGKRIVYYNEEETEGGNCAFGLTSGERYICKTDKDCHKHNPDLVCVSHYGTVKTKIVEGEMEVKYDLHETENGKCTLENKLPNVVESVEATPEVSTFSSILSYLLSIDTGEDKLVDTLTGEGPFTVFAPNNDAFAKFSSDKLDDLKKFENKDQLKALLLRHVVPGELEATSIPNGSTKLKTLGGEEISVVKTNGVRVQSSEGEANVITTDVDGNDWTKTMAENGVIHILDSVI